MNDTTGSEPVRWCGLGCELPYGHDGLHDDLAGNKWDGVPAAAGQRAGADLAALHEALDAAALAAFTAETGGAEAAAEAITAASAAACMAFPAGGAGLAAFRAVLAVIADGPGGSMSAARARAALSAALRALAGASGQDAQRCLSAALEAADRYAVAAGTAAGVPRWPCCGHCTHGEGGLPPDMHTLPCSEGCNDTGSDGLSAYERPVAAEVTGNPRLHAAVVQRAGARLLAELRDRTGTGEPS